MIQLCIVVVVNACEGQCRGPPRQMRTRTHSKCREADQEQRGKLGVNDCHRESAVDLGYKDLLIAEIDSS